MERVSNVLSDALSIQNKVVDVPQTPFLDEPSQEQLDKLWQKALDTFQVRLDGQIFEAWIRPLRLRRITPLSKKERGESSVAAVISAPNRFSLSHIERQYSQLISNTLAKILAVKTATLSFEVSSESLPPRTSSIVAAKALEPRSNTNKERVHPERTLGWREANLNPKYNFSNFVVGACNQFPHAVSLRVSENLGSNYNPLFIYGGVGLGKTHLVNAIGNACRRRGKKVLLVSSELFVSELIASLRSNSMHKFKERFRSLDLLIIDDIQFLIGKERTQEEFFHTFNELYNRRRQIVITSDKIPQELIGLEERLKTRFASGLSADLQPPDFETRVAILTKKAELHAMTLGQDAARLLAERITTNVRELEGALNRLHAVSGVKNQPITVELVQQVIEVITPERRREVTTDSIQKTVAQKFNVSVHDILGKRRTQNIALARQVAMYLCRRLTGCSYPEIGALFGGRDHSTVIHAKRVIEDKVRSDGDFSRELQAIESRLYSLS